MSTLISSRAASFSFSCRSPRTSAMTCNSLLVSFHFLLFAVAAFSFPSDKRSNLKSACQCSLPAAWVADYAWSDSATGKIFIDFDRQLFASSENPGGRFQYQLMIQGTQYYAGTTINRQHYVFSRELHLPFSHCLNNGRETQPNRLLFDFVNSQRIPATNCGRRMLHNSTRLRLWVDSSTCRPVSLQLTSFFQDVATQEIVGIIPTRYLLHNVENRGMTSNERTQMIQQSTSNTC